MNRKEEQFLILINYILQNFANLLVAVKKNINGGIDKCVMFRE